MWEADVWENNCYHQTEDYVWYFQHQKHLFSAFIFCLPQVISRKANAIFSIRRRVSASVFKTSFLATSALFSNNIDSEHIFCGLPLRKDYTPLSRSRLSDNTIKVAKVGGCNYLILVHWNCYCMSMKHNHEIFIQFYSITGLASSFDIPYLKTICCSIQTWLRCWIIKA